MSQFEQATEDELRQMLFLLDNYEYTEGQIEIYLLWAGSLTMKSTPQTVLTNMTYAGKQKLNAGQ